MRVLLIGSLNARTLGNMMDYCGIDVTLLNEVPRIRNTLQKIVSRFYQRYDVLVFVGVSFRARASIQLIVLALIGSKIVFYIVGSDAYRIHDNNRSKILLSLLSKLGCRILYVSSHLKKLVALDGEVIPIPVDTKMFRPIEGLERCMDILYYCPTPIIYKREWIEDYRRSHPEETVTILDGKLPYEEMPIIYNQHRKLIRMTTHDGFPKMPYEALLCGCEVWYNGEKVTEIPLEMRMEYTLPRFLNFIKEVVRN